MYILYDTNGQDILFASDTREEMADHLGTTSDKLRQLMNNYKARRRNNPNYQPKKPFVIAENEPARCVDHEKVILMAREGCSAALIARRLGASCTHVQHLMEIYMDEIGEVKGSMVKKSANNIPQELLVEWERVRRKLLSSGRNLKIPLARR